MRHIPLSICPFTSHKSRIPETISHINYLEYAKLRSCLKYHQKLHCSSWVLHLMRISGSFSVAICKFTEIGILLPFCYYWSLPIAIKLAAAVGMQLAQEHCARVMTEKAVDSIRCCQPNPMLQIYQE